MKILFSVPFLYPAISYGGAARATYDLAAALQQSGHEITVVTTDVWDQHNRFNGHHDPAQFEVMRLRNFSNSMAYWYQFYSPLSLNKKVQPLLRDVKIVHLHTYRNLLNDRIARAAYRANIPFILTGHGTIPIIERFQTAKRFYDDLIGRWQLDHAAALIAISQSEKTKLQSFGIEEARIQVIPNGIPEIHSAVPGKFRKKWNIHSDEKILIFLGKITERKGLQYVVRALPRIKDARLIIAGNDMGYENQIDRVIKELAIGHRIIRTGLLNDEEKASALTDADVAVYPSRDEAFGLVAVESILCGTPVIVCNDDGCAQLVKKVGAGNVVNWGNVDELVQTIDSQLTRGKDQKEMRQAKDILVHEYSWKNIAAETSRLYETFGGKSL